VLLNQEADKALSHSPVGIRYTSKIYDIVVYLHEPVSMLNVCANVLNELPIF